MSERNPGKLLEALERLPPELQQLLSQHHFNRDQWLKEAELLWNPPSRGARLLPVTAPRPADIGELPAPGSAEEARLRALGEEALRHGHCALILLAGGMATRMGGRVKALIDAVEGASFLSLRLREQENWAERVGALPPLWLMTSHSTEEPIRAALEHAARSSTLVRGALDEQRLATFPQNVSIRWTPEGEIFRGEDELPSLYSTGHGDLPEALQKSGLLDAFIARGGRAVLVCNIDNLGAGFDPLLLGLHLSRAESITCEVVDKRDRDRGGIPVRQGARVVIREEFLLPPDFDPSTVRVFNSNTLTFDVDVLARLDFPWTYFQVKKQVAGQDVIQFERLIHETTTAHPTHYVRVPREGLSSRFLPVKNEDDLTEQRAEITRLAEARGMLRKHSP